jgi:hypothetical protein
MASGGSNSPTRQDGKGRWGGRALSALLGLFGLAGGFAEAKPPAAPTTPPAEWVAYATKATQMLAEQLNGKDDPAPAFRAALDATKPAPDQPVPPLMLKIWIDPAGALSRVDHTPFTDPQADADLSILLIGRQLGPPPRDMLQPIRLSIQLAPAPDAADPDQPGAQKGPG